MEFFKSMLVAASGMRAQTTRMKVVAENIANSNSTGLNPGEEPYRPQVPTFSTELDRATGVQKLKVEKIGFDTSPFERRYEPNHPAADESGYILLPNVNSLVEMVDMREAQRTYEANLSVINTSRAMLMQTVELLK